MAAHLDDLIYSFLLQSDFPRASIIIDADMLGPVAQIGDGMRRPSFIIVDPETAELLAVINVVDAIDADALRQVSVETGAFASRLAGRTIQGFVIRVNVRGRTEEEQIQFYRIWPNSTLQQLSSKSFPDIDTLRVARKLATASSTLPASISPDITGKTDSGKSTGRHPGAGMYFPAIALLILVIADSYFTQNHGVPFLSITQGVLAFGAAALFTLPAAIRFLRS